MQAALAATSTATSDRDGEIPAPPAEESAGIDYDSLYSLYFDKPATYIRFSQTVEECRGCQYDMTTEDDLFLIAYNKSKPPASKLSEDDFEKIMEVFEETADNQAPFAAVDNTVIPFETMNLALRQQLEQKLQAFSKDIFDFWKTRRQDSGNKPLQPSLKFETHQDNDDGDPYVCFRRREVRQTRKTRARDTQSTDRLKKLRKELEEARAIVMMASVREATKRELLISDRSIFQQRGILKETKIKLGIKTDDEVLINQKVCWYVLDLKNITDMLQPQKRKLSDYTQLQRPPGPPLRLPGRSDGRAIDADLIQLKDVIEQKEILLRQEIETKSEQHRRWNENYTDLTREPLSPVHGNSPDPGFRPVTTSWQLLTPPSSVTSDSFDQHSPVQEKSEPFFRYGSPPEDDEPRGQPAYRRRIGRCGRLWIDRRGMPSVARGGDDIVSDRWKYDQDDDDEQPVYEMDPYDTNSLRFRATIPIPSHLLPSSQRPRLDGQVARTNGVSPSNNRGIASAPQPQAPT